MPSIPNAYREVIQLWRRTPLNHPESPLEADLINPMFQLLGLNASQVIHTPNISNGNGGALKPDILIRSSSGKPLLVVENKRRASQLASSSEEEFIKLCKTYPNAKPLYLEAVGYPEKSGNNGIKQYLDVSKVDENCLAPYGLVFNGDFFQLWRRTDGLIVPFTDILRFKEDTIPKILRQLQFCIKNSHRASVNAIWNRKGGVAKTTNTINIGATLAIKGRKVLLIDLDPQNDLTRGLAFEIRRTDNLKPIIRNLQLKESKKAKDLLDEIIQEKRFDTVSNGLYPLYLLTFAPEILESFRSATDIPVSTKIKIIVKIVDLLRKDFDYIFIDTSPDLDLFTQCCLHAADNVLISSDMGRKSLFHAVHIDQKICAMRQRRASSGQLLSSPWNLGIVHSNCPGNMGTVVPRLIKEDLKNRRYLGKCYSTQLKSYGHVRVAEFRHKPVVSWQGWPISVLYSQLVNEVFLEHNFIPG